MQPRVLKSGSDKVPASICDTKAWTVGYVVNAALLVQGHAYIHNNIYNINALMRDIITSATVNKN